MSVFSKLLKKDPLSHDGDGDGVEPFDIAIDVTFEDVEDDAQAIPSPTTAVPISGTILTSERSSLPNVHDRPTLVDLDPVVAEERTTVVAPAPLIAILAEVTATTAPPLGRTAPHETTPPHSSPPRPLTKPPLPLPKPERPLSKPPPLPSQRPEALQVEEGELERNFAALQRGGPHFAGPGTLAANLGDVHTLFGQIARTHMRQVRDFIIELRWGSTPKTWLDVCESAVESLRRAAETLEFAALASGLHDLATAMQASRAAPALTIEDAERDRILDAHAALEALLPDTFALDGDRSLREATILHALLSQVPDVGKVTIDKLYAAGLTTLETMLLATTEDIVATTAIPELIAERIAQRFRRYRAEMASAAIDDARTQERAKIALLVEELRGQNNAFERAAAAWTKDAIQQKKDILLARGQTTLEIDLQLARLGEIALVRELERLPFARKLIALDGFLAATDTK